MSGETAIVRGNAGHTKEPFWTQRAPVCREGSFRRAISFRRAGQTAGPAGDLPFATGAPSADNPSACVFQAGSRPTGNACQRPAGDPHLDLCVIDVQDGAILAGFEGKRRRVWLSRELAPFVAHTGERGEE